MKTQNTHGQHNRKKAKQDLTDKVGRGPRKTDLRRHMNDSRVHGKLLSILSHQGNDGPNHAGTSLIRTALPPIHQEPGKMWRKRASNRI